jgi:carbamoyl-phosphate synthase large subunit
MNSKSIIVTSVGGGVGQSLLKALQDSTYRVIAVDAEPLAVGLHASEKSYIGKYATDPDYIYRLLEIAEKENVGIIFPGHDEELLQLSANKNIFLSKGITPVVSDEDVIRVCDDKLATVKFLQKIGLPHPKTYTFDEFMEFTGPVVLKPQFGGARSRNTYIASTEDEFKKYANLIDTNNCVVQEYISGDEYTCGSVTLGGAFMGSISMRRTLRSGDTYKAFVEFIPEIDAAVKKVCQSLEVFGALNIQLKLKDGIPYIFEINARSSGTTGARALAGFNEPIAIADFLYQSKIPIFNIQKKSILRYWKEIIISETDLGALKKMLVSDGSGKKL